jgi:putative protein kinase ArgK-like GTPase of G3E family
MCAVAVEDEVAAIVVDPGKKATGGAISLEHHVRVRSIQLIANIEVRCSCLGVHKARVRTYVLDVDLQCGEVGVDIARKERRLLLHLLAILVRYQKSRGAPQNG